MNASSMETAIVFLCLRQRLTAETFCLSSVIGGIAPRTSIIEARIFYFQQILVICVLSCAAIVLFLFVVAAT